MGLRRPFQAPVIVAYQVGSDVPLPFNTIAELEAWGVNNLASGETLSYDQRGANPDAGRTVYTVP